MAKSANREWTISKEEIIRLVKEHNGTINDVLVTPVMAEFMLSEYNSGNRKLRSSHANSFVDTIKRGGWVNTGESIIFSKELVLNNGQHRLFGVVKSKTPAIMDLRFGIPRSAFSVTDTGSKRLSGDVLSISGSTSPFAAAAALKLLLAYEEGLPGSYIGVKVGNDQILKAYQRWPMIEQAVDMNHRKIPRRGFLNASSNAFTFLAVRQTDDEAVEEFLGLVESGLTRTKNDAPRLLRERLLADSKITSTSRTAVVERFALFIKSWNFWREGHRPNVLRWTAAEEFPVIPNVNL